MGLLLSMFCCSWFIIFWQCSSLYSISLFSFIKLSTMPYVMNVDRFFVLGNFYSVSMTPLITLNITLDVGL